MAVRNEKMEVRVTGLNEKKEEIMTETERQTIKRLAELTFDYLELEYECEYEKSCLLGYIYAFEELSNINSSMGLSLILNILNDKGYLAFADCLFDIGYDNKKIVDVYVSELKRLFNDYILDEIIREDEDEEFDCKDSSLVDMEDDPNLFDSDDEAVCEEMAIFDFDIGGIRINGRINFSGRELLKEGVSDEQSHSYM